MTIYPVNPMLTALEYARKARETGEIPVGAVIVDPQSGKTVAAFHNLTETASDPTGHAEIAAIREACRLLGSPRLNGLDMYVTLEPCPMCAQAISFARLRRLYFGAYDPKGGGVEHGPRIFHQPTCHHTPEVIGGIEETVCAGILKHFFASKR